MKGEMRALGLAHGLLLGLLLGALLIAPDLSPVLISALFFLGGFDLRLADRRRAPRGALSWVSHIRMAPLRLTRWAALASVAQTRPAGQARGRVAGASSGAIIAAPKPAVARPSARGSPSGPRSQKRQANMPVEKASA